MAGMETIIKRPEVNVNAHILAMWLLFLFAPSKPDPEPDEFFKIGRAHV